MINYNDNTKESINVCNLHSLRIPDHPCIILIIGSSVSRKIKVI